MAPVPPPAAGPEPCEQSLQALEAAFPNAHKAELRRFAIARPRVPSDAVKLYEDHLIWRAEEGSPEALAKAWTEVPPYVFSGVGEQGPALDGTGVLFLELGRYDVSVPVSTYVKAACYLLDQALPRELSDQITVVIDTRAGEDWCNPNPLAVMPLLQGVIQTTSRNYPERCRRIIVYPVPWVAGCLVSMAKRMMDPATSSKLQIITGSDSVDVCPSDALGKFLSADSFPLHSRSRHAGMVPSDVVKNSDVGKDNIVGEALDISVNRDEAFFSADEE